MTTNLKLGTRRSLLAWAQSSWVAREIERLNPDTKVELVGIDTRGDRIQNVPLHALKDQGKEFFVAELDDALKGKSVDLTVHSLKDLSLDRPSEFVLGAIPRRENPRDVIVFGPNALARLREGKAMRVGTSSPRRVENIPSFLKQALPGGNASVEFVEIRGNVNTRLARVQEPLESERYLDAVVLAFAGLIRLWADSKAREEMRPLFRGARWMVLPLRECPAAPGQGALAVECRADDQRVRDRLARLHDATSASHVAAEREVLAASGGGCHQRFGATAIRAGALERLLFVRGSWPDGSHVDERRFARPPRARGVQPRPWNGTEWRKRGEPSELRASSDATARAPEGAAVAASAQPTSKILTADLKITAGQSVFVAHSRAVEALGENARSISDARVWTSGTGSWFRLAKAGYWVEGCADGLGYDHIASTLSEPVLELQPQWTVLTHDSAMGWPNGVRVINTYAVGPEIYDDVAVREIAKATHIYWSSGSQFDLLNRYIAERLNEISHASGPGKTAQHLEKHGIRADIFPSAEDWKEWVSK